MGHLALDTDERAIEITYDGGDYVVVSLRPNDLPRWTASRREVCRTEDDALRTAVSMGCAAEEAVRAIAACAAENLACYAATASKASLSRWREWAAKA